MFDIAALIKQEKRSIVIDAILAGFYLAALVVLQYSGSEWYWIAIVGAMLGGRISSALSRPRVMMWMDHVQRQDAVIESLVTTLEADAPIQVPSQRNGRS